MRSFLIKISLFCLPVILYCILPTWVLYTTRENFYNADRFIDDLVENENQYLIGYVYNDQASKYIKYRVLNKLPRQGVVALGSSRAEEFRSEMFDMDFYNAGYMIRKLKEFQVFLDLIPHEKSPEVLLLGLDQWMFVECWDDQHSEASPTKYTKNSTTNLNLGATNFLRFYRNLFDGRIDFNKVMNPPDYECVGLDAVINEKGLRNDGSMRYGQWIQDMLNDDKTMRDYNFKDTFRQIDRGSGPFCYGDQLVPEAIEVLSELLMYCASREIFVIGFIPPLPDAVNQRMEITGKYAYLDQLVPTLAPLFKPFGFEFYDFGTHAKCNSSDSEALDGFHGGEKTYLRILVSMLEQGSILNNYTSLARLNNDLEKSPSDFVVYPD